MRTVSVIDSHTEGEPTRVVMSGFPDLGAGDVRLRLETFRERFDDFRSAVCCEPRGSDALVGALVLPPSDADAVAAVIYFNNVGYLKMCVHGTIGVGATLLHAGAIEPGRHALETPAGRVVMEVAANGRVDVDNVESRRVARGVCVRTAGHGTVTGDVAWGGNWFFLCDDHGLEIALSNRERLTACAWDIRRSLATAGITGDDGGEIDHVELFGPPTRSDADSKNFVLCPGGAYDRSPCGTGTSAKLACLYAEGLLDAGRTWRQESIIGSVFEGSITPTKRGVLPRIAGRAWITAEATLVFADDDPLAAGIRP